jgi:hypothetical protein
MRFLKPPIFQVYLFENLNKLRIFLGWHEINEKNKWIMNYSFSVNNTLIPGNPHTKTMRSTNVSVSYHIPVIEEQQQVLTSVKHSHRSHTRETSEPKQSGSFTPPQSTLDFRMSLKTPH